jgi:hypothetical protein
MDDPIVNWIDGPEPELDVEPGSDWNLPTQLRINIIPQLESLANNLWDTGTPSLGRKLDNIVDEIRSLLDAKNE